MQTFVSCLLLNHFHLRSASIDILTTHINRHTLFSRSLFFSTLFRLINSEIFDSISNAYSQSLLCHTKSNANSERKMPCHLYGLLNFRCNFAILKTKISIHEIRSICQMRKESIDAYAYICISSNQ